MCVGIAAFELLLGPLVPTIGGIMGSCIERLFYGCAINIVAPPSRFYIEVTYPLTILRDFITKGLRFHCKQREKLPFVLKIENGGSTGHESFL